MARRALLALRNADYTDRELLHILDDLGQGDPEGWASTSDLAEVIRIQHPDANGNGAISDEARERYAKHCIATRFSWMVRFKYVERDEDRTHWRVTDLGRDLMNGKLTKAVEGALDKMKPGDRVLAMRMLTQGYRKADPGSIMLRREYQHQTSGR